MSDGWPIWEVWNTQGGDKRKWAVKVRALDAQHAAEVWGEQYDCGDYDIARGDPETVFVAKPGEVPRKYTVTADTVIVYSAEEVE